MPVEFRTQKRLSLEHTVLRIAQIVCGHVSGKSGKILTQKPPRLKDKDDTDELNWVLDPIGNDWFLLLQKEDDTFRYWRLSYRYTDDDRQICLNGVGKFIQWELGRVIDSPMTPMEFEAWVNSQWDTEFDGLESIDLMHAAYSKGLAGG